MSPSRSERLKRALKRADQQLGHAVESTSATGSVAYLNGAVGMLILAVELQGEEIDALRESVRKAHVHASAVDDRTIGMTRLG